jgi:hypothetical protein
MLLFYLVQSANSAKHIAFGCKNKKRFLDSRLTVSGELRIGISIQLFKIK